MATSYPAIFDVQRPEKFDRAQIFLRLLVVIILSIFAGAIGWIFGLVYLVFPVIAAVLISQKNGQRYLQEDGERVTGWLRWVLAVYAYLGLLTDKLPTEKPEEIIRFEVRTSGQPTVGSALLRLIFSIPSAFVLGILGIVSAIVLVIAIISVLINETYSQGLYDFQRGILRWQARLLAYHSSLVDEYPPFAVDTGPEGEAGAHTPAPSAPPADAPPEAPEGETTSEP
jgi:hypothetical protein